MAFLSATSELSCHCELARTPREHSANIARTYPAPARSTPPTCAPTDTRFYCKTQHFARNLTFRPHLRSVSRAILLSLHTCAVFTPTDFTCLCFHFLLDIRSFSPHLRCLRTYCFHLPLLSLPNWQPTKLTSSLFPLPFQSNPCSTLRNTEVSSKLPLIIRRNLLSYPRPLNSPANASSNLQLHSPILCRTLLSFPRPLNSPANASANLQLYATHSAAHACQSVWQSAVSSCIPQWYATHSATCELSCQCV